MPGLSDYSAQNLLDWASGQDAMPALPDVWLALFTTAPQDSGSGGTEVSGGSYARVQVAGSEATNNTTAAGNAVLNFASVPAWIQPGMSVRNITSPATIPGGTTVVSKTGTTVTMSANAAGAGVGNGDSIRFSSFTAATAASGTEPDTLPAQVVNNSVVTFPQATADWGVVTAFGLYDASTTGNLLAFDFLGNYEWHPFTCTSASPGVLTSPGIGFANGNSAVVTEKYGGSLPTTGGSWAGIKTVANVSGDTFTVGVNTTSTGDGLIRRVTQQSIPENVTASFAASTLTVTAA